MTVDAMADIDVTGYLSRIAYTGPTEPTLDVLTALVAAHNRSIPFENLDPVMGVPVADLGPDALSASWFAVAAAATATNRTG